MQLITVTQALKDGANYITVMETTTNRFNIVMGGRYVRSQRQAEKKEYTQMGVFNVIRRFKGAIITFDFL